MMVGKGFQLLCGFGIPPKQSQLIKVGFLRLLCHSGVSPLSISQEIIF
jgi:hypothetical protein